MTRRRKTTVTFASDGWTGQDMEPKRCMTILPRRLAGLPPCEEPTVWRVEKHGSGYVQTGYYCDEHLPAEYRRGGAA